MHLRRRCDKIVARKEERAGVVELVDTWCSGRHGRNARKGSSPFSGTIFSRARRNTDGRLAVQ